MNFFQKSEDVIQLKENDAHRLIHQMREGSKLNLDLDGAKLLVQIKEKKNLRHAFYG